MVSLSNIQQQIINQLLLNSEQNHSSLASTVQSARLNHQQNLSQFSINMEDTIQQHIFFIILYVLLIVYEIYCINHYDDLEILQDSQIQSNDQELQIYNQNEQPDELEAKLSKCQTEEALFKIEKQRQNKFLTQPSKSKSPKSSRQQQMTLSTMYSVPKLTIYKRSISPAFTTFRHLFSVIRI